MAKIAIAEEAADTLFDLQPYSEKRICKNEKCGREFVPRPQNQKFCSSKCKKAFFHNKTDQEIKIRYRLIQQSKAQPPETLGGKDKRAVVLYRSGLGLGAIARELNESKTNVRRRLVYAGEYNPGPEKNTLARKGTGKFSKVLQRERIKKRNEEWRHRMAVCLWNLRHGIEIKVTCKSEGWSSVSIWRRLKDKRRLLRWVSSHASNLENISDHRSVRIIRHRIAVCLWNFYRHKIAVETFCHSKGWNPSVIWNYLHKSKTYKKSKALRPSKTENVRQYKNRIKWKWHSQKYLEESKFREVIKQLIEAAGMTCVSEKKLRHSRNRADFRVNDSIYVECKIVTKPFERAMGQALNYKNEGKEVWIVLPDDVAVRSDQLERLEEIGVKVFSETTLRDKLAGRENIGRVQTKATSRFVSQGS